jgi:uncharacterized protein YqjF (DUF2071 family)
MKEMLRVFEGVVARRLVVNFRVDPEVAAGLVPAPLEPARLGGAAVAGMSLIRLEQIRPRGLAPIVGLAIENMAHWVAVTAPVEDGRVSAFFVLRRDTESRLVATLGGPLFSAAHHLAQFDVDEDERHLRAKVRTDNGAADVEVEVDWGAAFRGTPCFPSLGAAERFFREFERGFTASETGGLLAAVRLRPSPVRLEPVRLVAARCRYFEDPKRFPEGSVTLDGALGMRSIPYEWVAVKEVPEILEEPLLPQPA